MPPRKSMLGKRKNIQKPVPYQPPISTTKRGLGTGDVIRKCPERLNLTLARRRLLWSSSDLASNQKYKNEGCRVQNEERVQSGNKENDGSRYDFATCNNATEKNATTCLQNSTTTTPLSSYMIRKPRSSNKASIPEAPLLLKSSRQQRLHKFVNRDVMDSNECDKVFPKPDHVDIGNISAPKLLKSNRSEHFVSLTNKGTTDSCRKDKIASFNCAETDIKSMNLQQMSSFSRHCAEPVQGVKIMTTDCREMGSCVPPSACFSSQTLKNLTNQEECKSSKVFCCLRGMDCPTNVMHTQPNKSHARHAFQRDKELHNSVGAEMKDLPTVSGSKKVQSCESYTQPQTQSFETDGLYQTGAGTSKIPTRLNSKMKLCKSGNDQFIKDSMIANNNSCITVGKNLECNEASVILSDLPSHTKRSTLKSSGSASMKHVRCSDLSSVPGISTESPLKQGIISDTGESVGSDIKSRLVCNKSSSIHLGTSSEVEVHTGIVMSNTKKLAEQFKVSSEVGHPSYVACNDNLAYPADTTCMFGSNSVSVSETATSNVTKTTQHELVSQLSNSSAAGCLMNRESVVHLFKEANILENNTMNSSTQGKSFVNQIIEQSVVHSGSSKIVHISLNSEKEVFKSEGMFTTSTATQTDFSNENVLTERDIICIKSAVDKVFVLLESQAEKIQEIQKQSNDLRNEMVNIIEMFNNKEMFEMKNANKFDENNSSCEVIPDCNYKSLKLSRCSVSAETPLRRSARLLAQTSCTSITGDTPYKSLAGSLSPEQESCLKIECSDNKSLHRRSTNSLRKSMSVYKDLRKSFGFLKTPQSVQQCRKSFVKNRSKTTPGRILSQCVHNQIQSLYD